MGKATSHPTGGLLRELESEQESEPTVRFDVMPFQDNLAFRVPFVWPNHCVRMKVNAVEIRLHFELRKDVESSCERRASTYSSQ